MLVGVGGGAAATAAAALALNPRERSSGPSRINAVDDDVAQSAKAPVSDARCLLVVATMTMIITKLYICVFKIFLPLIVQKKKLKISGIRFFFFSNEKEIRSNKSGDEGEGVKVGSKSLKFVAEEDKKERERSVFPVSAAKQLSSCFLPPLSSTINLCCC